jgi:hypothetical protein
MAYEVPSLRAWACELARRHGAEAQDATFLAELARLELIVQRYFPTFPAFQLPDALDAWRFYFTHQLGPLVMQTPAPRRSVADLVLFADEGPRTAAKVFLAFELIFPKRVTEEQFGDALEFIVKHRLEGTALWIKIASSACWVSLSGFREIVSSLLGKKPV